MSANQPAHPRAGFLSALTLLCGLSAQPALAEGITLPETLVSDARAYAAGPTEGQKIGGSVNILGANGGQELNMLKAAWAPFEEATGIKVDYNGTTDFAAILQTRVKAGDPPDLAGSYNIGNVMRYADQGALLYIATLIGPEAGKDRFVAGLVDAVSRDGKVLGLWTEVNNFMVWYNVQAYDGPKDAVTAPQFAAWAAEKAASGQSPWCYADERGAASGLVGANWIQGYLLKNFGPEVMAGLIDGSVRWTGPEARTAFEAFCQMVHTEGMVNGGAVTAMSTPAVRISTGLFAAPPQCAALQWGTYAGGLTTGLHPDVKPIENLDFMPIPGKPEFAHDETFGGTVYMAFKDTPQIRAFLRYLASEQAQRLVVSLDNWTVASAAVKPEDYDAPLLRRARETMLSEKTVLVAQPTLVLSPAFIQAFGKGVVEYALDPESLNDVLDALDGTAGS